MVGVKNIDRPMGRFNTERTRTIPYQTFHPSRCYSLGNFCQRLAAQLRNAKLLAVAHISIAVALSKSSAYTLAPAIVRQVLTRHVVVIALAASENAGDANIFFAVTKYSPRLNRPVGSIPLTGSPLAYRYLWSDAGSLAFPSSGSRLKNLPVLGL